MKCRTASEWMDALLDETLEPHHADGGADGGAGRATRARRAVLEQHLAACPGCRRQWEALQAAERVLRVPQPATVPAGMLADFRQRLAAEQAGNSIAAEPPRQAWWERWMGNWWIPAGTLGAAAAAAAFAFMVRTPPLPSNVPMAQTPIPQSNLEELRSRPNVAPEVPSPTPRDSATAHRKGATAADSTTSWHGGTARATVPNPRQPSAPKSTSVGGRHLERSPSELPNHVQGRRIDKMAMAETTQLERLAPQLHERKAGDGSAAALGAPFGTAVKNGVRFEEAQVEFEVSPAVLMALRRSVSVKSEPLPVAQALQELALAADVDLQLDPSSAAVPVSPAGKRGEAYFVQQNRNFARNADQSKQEGQELPLWYALQNVAQQAKLEIVPVDNQLLLKPMGEASPTANYAQNRFLYQQNSPETKQQSQPYRQSQGQIQPPVRRMSPMAAKPAEPTAKQPPLAPATTGLALSAAPAGPQGPAGHAGATVPAPPAPARLNLDVGSPAGPGGGMPGGLGGGFGAGQGARPTPVTPMALGKAPATGNRVGTRSRGAIPAKLDQDFSQRGMALKRDQAKGDIPALGKKMSQLSDQRPTDEARGGRGFSLSETEAALSRESRALFLADRRVWPANWGFLPERGFILPSQEEFDRGRVAVPVRPAAKPKPKAAKKQSQARPKSRRR